MNKSIDLGSIIKACKELDFRLMSVDVKTQTLSLYDGHIARNLRIEELFNLYKGVFSHQ